MGYERKKWNWGEDNLSVIYFIKHCYIRVYVFQNLELYHKYTKMLLHLLLQGHL